MPYTGAMLPRSPLLLCVLSFAIGCGALACGDATTDDGVSTSEDDELRSLAASEILGSLGYGETSAPVAYTKTPLYRAFRFDGRKGDRVEAWVRSTDGGDARAWLLRGSFATLASNLDASAGVKDARVEATLEETGPHYVVFRETKKASATFTVALAKVGGACDLPTVKTPTWATTAAPPEGHVVFDTKRGRLVAFTRAGTSELAPGGWTPPSGDPLPPGRRDGAAITFDSERGRAVLFGGSDDATSQPLGDTWEWDSETNTWTQLSPAGIMPRARRGHAIAYDGARKRVVLYGGYAGPDAMEDTWTWDGTSWQRVGTAAAPHPSPRTGHGMAFDAKRGRLVLHGRSGPFIVGNVGQPNRAPTDTWEWDGSAWTKAPRSGEGSVTSDGPYTLPMAYDATRGVVLRVDVVGARYGQTFTLLEWTGSAWTSTSGSAKGPAVDVASAPSYGGAYDAGRARFLLTSSGYPRAGREFFFFEEPNRAPELAPVAGQRVFAGDMLHVQLAARDADGHAVRYRVSPLPPSATYDEVTGLFAWRPTVADVGTHALVAEATDGCAAQTKAFSVEVVHLAYAKLPAGDVALSGTVKLQAEVRRTTPNGSWTAYSAWPELACDVSGKNPGKVVVTCAAGSTQGSAYQSSSYWFALPPMSASLESDLTFALRDEQAARTFAGSLEPLVDGTYKLHVTGYAQTDEAGNARVTSRAAGAGVVDVAP